MTPTRWTMLATGLAGPLGAIAAALLLGRIVDGVQGGMAGLAAVVGGMILGGPILALIAFTVCELTLLRGTLPRPVFTWFAMAFGAILGGMLTLLVLSVVARTGSDTAILGFALAIPGLWYAAAAFLAIRAGVPRE